MINCLKTREEIEMGPESCGCTVKDGILWLCDYHSNLGVGIAEDADV